MVPDGSGSGCRRQPQRRHPVGPGRQGGRQGAAERVARPRRVEDLLARHVSAGNSRSPTSRRRAAVTSSDAAGPRGELGRLVLVGDDRVGEGEHVLGQVGVRRAC